MLTYKQAYDRLTEAYIKDQIQPYNPEFCFCGTLNDSSPQWFNSSCAEKQANKHNDGIHYSGEELFAMENEFLNHLHVKLNTAEKYDPFSLIRKGIVYTIYHPQYEQVLFEAFCKALDVLKQIHIDRGEVIDEVPEFKKRVLTKA